MGMLKEPRLSEEQIEAFHRDGFVVLPHGFDADEMAQIEAWTRELAARPEESGKHWVYHEKSLIDADHEIVSRIENISPFHDGFAELSAALQAPVAQLLGEKAVLFKEKINFKMPGGDGYTPHQDSQAGWWKYGDYYISVLVSIDESTAENGCLKLAAGHHKQGLFREWEPLTEEDMKDMDFVSYPTQPGDVVFFDSYAPHRSEPNRSQSTRRIYFATYNAASAGDHLAEYYADKFETHPPDIDRQADKDYAYRV
jgi:ectoine hydroxylase-related dioxygenase (phytanoyl-CoA dioxygenase family)